jgi:hypothetical protein
MTDIVDQLREHSDWQQFRWMTVSAVLRKGADEIERLREKNERLQGTLAVIRDQNPVENALDPQWAARLAALALLGGEHE